MEGEGEVVEGHMVTVNDPHHGFANMINMIMLQNKPWHSQHGSSDEKLSSNFPFGNFDYIAPIL